MTALLLIGPPGTGKSAVLGELEELGWMAADVDIAVSRTLGIDERDLHLDLPRDQLAATQREIARALFGDIEQIAVDCAIAIPTSVAQAERETIVELRDSGTAIIVALSASLDKLVMRNGLVGVRSNNVVLPRKELRRHLADHQPLYDDLSSETLDTTEATPAEVAAELHARYSSH